MKYCLIVTGTGEIGPGVGRMAASLQLTETGNGHGFQLYQGENTDMPDIAMLDMEALDEQDCAEKIRDLSRDHQLTMFCATDDHRIKMQKIFGPKLAIKPFDLAHICAHMGAAH